MKTILRSRPTRALVLGLSLTALTLLPGCLAVVVGAGAGAGAVAYVRGELDATVEATLDQTFHATTHAIEQLQFAKISENKDALEGIVVARTADDRKIKIRLERTAGGLTKIEIRVGVFGDEALSQVVLEKIRAGL